MITCGAGGEKAASKVMVQHLLDAGANIILKDRVRINKSRSFPVHTQPKVIRKMRSFPIAEKRRCLYSCAYCLSLYLFLVSASTAALLFTTLLFVVVPNLPQWSRASRSAAVDLFDFPCFLACSSFYFHTIFMAS